MEISLVWDFEVSEGLVLLYLPTSTFPVGVSSRSFPGSLASEIVFLRA